MYECAVGQKAILALQDCLASTSIQMSVYTYVNHYVTIETTFLTHQQQ